MKRSDISAWLASEFTVAPHVREMAQFVFHHPDYAKQVVIDWLKTKPKRINFSPYLNEPKNICWRGLCNAQDILRKQDGNLRIRLEYGGKILFVIFSNPDFVGIKTASFSPKLLRSLQKKFVEKRNKGLTKNIWAKIINEFLPPHDFVTCSRVCKMWNEITCNPKPRAWWYPKLRKTCELIGGTNINLDGVSAYKLYINLLEPRNVGTSLGSCIVWFFTFEYVAAESCQRFMDLSLGKDFLNHHAHRNKDRASSVVYFEKIPCLFTYRTVNSALQRERNGKYFTTLLAGGGPNEIKRLDNTMHHTYSASTIRKELSKSLKKFFF